jgi:biopolymer transport protein TolR
MDPHGRRRRKLMGDINMIPLIDVMLVLLIVFMVAAPLMTQGIKVDLPKANSEVVPDSDEMTLVVSIDAESNYFISLGSTDEAQEPVALERIGESVERILRQNASVPVFLEADASINYGVVMNLLATLEGAGAESVRLVTQPPGGD